MYTMYSEKEGVIMPKMEKMEDRTSIQIPQSVRKHLTGLKRATGLPIYRIVAMAVSDWEHRNCGPGSEAGRVMVAITRQQRGIK